MSKFHIRFNTKHGGNTDLVWRVLKDGVEHLASDVKVYVPLHTETTIEHGETKWNMSCDGQILWDGTIAIINNE
jgi:hypothetical protein